MKLKDTLVELDNSNMLPKLMYLLNQLNDMYFLFQEKNMELRSPISKKVQLDLKESFETMFFDIEKQFPGFKIIGGPNGYNAVRKKK